MKRIILAAVILLLAQANELAAHPATGIVVDRSGNVYFSDLETIWKIDLKGQRSVFREGVSGRHIHELSIDANDNIYGADISYEPATERWISDIWKMTPAGQLTYLIEPTSNPPRGASMWFDRHGNMYQVDQNNHLRQHTVLLKRTPNGEVTVFAGGSYGHADGKGAAARFSSIGGMFIAPDDTVYLTDNNSVRKVASDGTVTTLARGLDFKTPNDDPRLFAAYGGLAGLAVDSAKNVYVADASKRRLLKIDPAGRVSVVLRNEAPYFPNGVAVANGSVYVLELGLTLPNSWSSPRVRKIAPDGKAEIVGPLNEEINRSLATRAGVTAERALAFITEHSLLTGVVIGGGVVGVTALLAWLFHRRLKTE
jgi:sugar lactone lactonase YvrE